MSLRENFIKFKMVIFFFIKIFFVLYIERNGRNLSEPQFWWRAAAFWTLFFFPFYKPSCYVLKVSKQLQNSFNSEYKMFWETFCNSEMVTKKSTSIRKANERYSHAHSHTRSGTVFYASSRNASSRKQTQPLTKKGSFKARITFPTI